MALGQRVIASEENPLLYASDNSGVAESVAVESERPCANRLADSVSVKPCWVSESVQFVILGSATFISKIDLSDVKT